MRRLDVNEVTFTEGRFYQKSCYSLPYEVRQFLYPQEGEGEFFYVDLSSAELRLLAWYYRDDRLMADIDSGEFWSLWTQGTLVDPIPKDALKRCIYCMQYSASNVTFPATAPKNLFREFTTRYWMWFEGIARTKRAFEGGNVRLANSYKNFVTGERIPLPRIEEHHSSFKCLNYRVQQSLSSYCQVLYVAVVKELEKAGGHAYCINFDSLTATYPNHDEVQFKELVGNVMQSLVAEGKLPCLIPFKTKHGRNFAEAQGWKPAQPVESDML